MIRIVLEIIIPLLLPLFLYLLWMWVLRHRAGARGDEAPGIDSTGLFWSLVTGIALVVAGLIWLALSRGYDPDAGTYQPPRYENGKIIPPGFSKQPVPENPE